MKYQLGLIGAGNMAGAILHSVLGQKLLPAEKIIAYDIDKVKLGEFSKLGVCAASDFAELAENASVVLFAIKPQNFGEVLSQLAPHCCRKQVFVSIAAGISADYLKKALGFDAKLVLVMPNTPLLIGCGAVALSRVEPTTEEEFSFVKSLFSASAQVEEIAPTQMNEVIPFNGSSPAFFYLFAKILVEEAVRLGFDENAANRLVCSTMIGSARMMLESGKNHQQLIDMVSSKGGTTLAALDALREHDFESAVLAAADACIRRARELGR